MRREGEPAHIPMTSSTPGSVSTGVGCRSISSPGRYRFRSLITGVLVVDPDMFYDLSLDWIQHPIGCLDSGSQKRAISVFGGLREKRWKNQQSRVEHPITDRPVSWSCLGIGIDLIPEAEGVGNPPEVA
jgi:hypothetical protein